jgi:hypothetical protein
LGDTTTTHFCQLVVRIDFLEPFPPQQQQQQSVIITATTIIINNSNNKSDYIV